MDNVQNCNSCVNIPSSQSYRSQNIISSFGMYIEHLKRHFVNKFSVETDQQQIDTDVDVINKELELLRWVLCMFCILHRLLA
jgi:tRNA C32,U32 (ribose-2'-O)-methylase TrmJ